MTTRRVKLNYQKVGVGLILALLLSAMSGMYFASQNCKKSFERYVVRTGEALDSARAVMAANRDTLDWLRRERDSLDDSLHSVLKDLDKAYAAYGSIKPISPRRPNKIVESLREVANTEPQGNE